MAKLRVIDEPPVALLKAENASGLDSIVVEGAQPEDEPPTMFGDAVGVDMERTQVDGQVISLLRRLSHLAETRAQALADANAELERVNTLLSQTQERLMKAEKQLAIAPPADSLTGLATRARLLERLSQEVAESLRFNTDLSVVMLDIDHFRRVNGTFGRPVGDRVVRELANQVKARTRETDFIARSGDDELMLVLPCTPLGGACGLAESLRVRVERHRFPVVGRITVSVGVAHFDPFAETITQAATGEGLMQSAALALDAARKRGRNCVASP